MSLNEVMLLVETVVADGVNELVQTPTKGWVLVALRILKA